MRKEGEGGESGEEGVGGGGGGGGREERRRKLGVGFERWEGFRLEKDFEGVVMKERETIGDEQKKK